MKGSLEQFAKRMCGGRIDKKKLGLMLGLVCVGLLLWGRLLLKQVPRTAVATPAAASVAAAGAASERGATSMRRAVVQVNLPQNLSRDPFRLDMSAYPRLSPEEAPVAEKSPPRKTDETLVVSLAARAREVLTLQTTILGDNPRALINGQLVAPGQKIEGFRLKEVVHRKAVLEMDGVEVTLEM